MSYYIGLYDNEKIVAGRWVRAESKEEATSKASWGLICLYPNVSFNEAKVLEVQI